MDQKQVFAFIKNSGIKPTKVYIHDDKIAMCFGEKEVYIPYTKEKFNKLVDVLQELDNYTVENSTMTLM